ncbi:uncharacterized protein LOC134933848 [Pseudophryne corroboree]|uniref:uncharacterized protein LOC134933848 n=1 Tax=Pseudophryne corroboree TaxID=495146 RepID=UPI00308183DC
MADTTGINNTQQGQQPSRPLGDRNRLDSLKENRAGAKPKALQSAQQQGQQPSRPLGDRNRLDSLEENRAGAKPKALQSAQQQAQQPSRPLGDRNRLDSLKENRAGAKPKALQSAQQNGNIEPGSRQEQKPTPELPEQVTLSFKWAHSKPEEYTTISADPQETIIDALQKDDDFTEHFNDLSYLIISAQSLRAIVNPSVPCGALSKGEKLVLKKPKLNKAMMKLLETPAYRYRPGGGFIIVRSKGETKGGANSIIVQDTHLFSTNLLAVYGYREESIRDALTNDKRFTVMNVFKLKTDTDAYGFSVQLSELLEHPNNTYTIITGKKPKVTKATKEPAKKRKRTGSPAETPQSSPAPYSHSASDPQGEAAAAAPSKEIVAILVESFDTFVRDSGGLDAAWKIISQQSDNNFLKMPIAVGPMRKVMKYAGNVALIRVREGDTVINQGTCFHLCEGLFLTCCHVVECALLKANGQCNVEVIFSCENPEQEKDLPAAVPAEIILYSEERDYAFILVRKQFIPVRKLFIRTEKQYFGANKQFIYVGKQLNYKKFIPARKQFTWVRKPFIWVRKPFIWARKQFIRARFYCAEGLLRHLGLPPENGVVTIIGHPKGKCKQIDFCSVINIPKCLAITEKLHQYPTFISLLNSYEAAKIKNPGLSAYKTSMYHGASGAPVFNETLQLVSMHTAGYTVPAPTGVKSLLEYGSCIVDILLYGLVHMENTDLKLTEMENLYLRLKVMAAKNAPLKEYIQNHQTHEWPIITQLLQDAAPNLEPGNDDFPMDTS